MNRALTKIAVVVLTASLISCSTNTQKQNTGIGVGTGAVVGGLLGSTIGGGAGKALAVGVGVVAGALIGGAVGHNMDSSDNRNMNGAVDAGRPATWQNPKSHTTYTVIPSRHYITVNGNHFCRKYVTKAVVNGKLNRVHGVACRQADGSWKAVATR